MGERPPHIPATTGPAAGPPMVDPASLSIEEVSRLLSAAGGIRVAPDQVQSDIDAGAPVGPDGRINLVHYTAWLVREVQAR